MFNINNDVIIAKLDALQGEVEDLRLRLLRHENRSSLSLILDKKLRANDITNNVNYMAYDTLEHDEVALAVGLLADLGIRKLHKKKGSGEEK